MEAYAMEQTAKQAAAQQQYYGMDAPTPSTSPFDSLGHTVSFLREIEAMADKIASRIVGADMKTAGAMYTGEAKGSNAIMAVPNLIERLECSNVALREIGESIARHLSRIESRL